MKPPTSPPIWLEDKASAEHAPKPAGLMLGSPVYLLPGWLDSGAQHWQSRWERLHGFVRVPQDDWLWPKRGDWMAQLDTVLLADERLNGTPNAIDAQVTPAPGQGAVLIAHSLGCQLVVAWAAHSQHTARVRAALLVAPPDVEREDMPPNLVGWRPIRRQRLPFAALALVSSNDPYCSPARAAEMAKAWGAALQDIGPRGHINDESGLGDWPEGVETLERWLAQPKHEHPTAPPARAPMR